MNEEEIIEFIDQLYGVKREYYNPVRVKNTENIITAIKSAVVLYQHEKEKNKKLVDRCKELIKEKQELTTICLNSIPTTKIAKIIGEFKDAIQTANGEELLIYDSKIDILEQLLEE